MKLSKEYRVMAIGALGYPYGCGYQGTNEDDALRDLHRLRKLRPEQKLFIQTRTVSEWK